MIGFGTAGIVCCYGRNVSLLRALWAQFQTGWISPSTFLCNLPTALVTLCSLDSPSPSFCPQAMTSHKSHRGSRVPRHSDLWGGRPGPFLPYCSLGMRSHPKELDLALWLQSSHRRTDGAMIWERRECTPVERLRPNTQTASVSLSLWGKELRELGAKCL